MKTSLFVSIVAIVILFASCSKDDLTAPKNLSGTVWKTAVDKDGFYSMLKLTGKTSYELSDYSPFNGFDIYDTGTYSLDENIIIFKSDDGFTDRATIEGDKLYWNDFYGEDVVFIKQ